MVNSGGDVSWIQARATKCSGRRPGPQITAPAVAGARARPSAVRRDEGLDEAQPVEPRREPLVRRRRGAAPPPPSGGALLPRRRGPLLHRGGGARGGRGGGGRGGHGSSGGDPPHLARSGG